MNTQSPFDENDKIALIKARTALGNAIDLMNRAVACGIDCTEKEMKRVEYDKILTAYQQHFFPDSL